jgi:hypothetical protein
MCGHQMSVLPLAQLTSHAVQSLSLLNKTEASSAANWRASDAADKEELIGRWSNYITRNSLRSLRSSFLLHFRVFQCSARCASSGGFAVVAFPSIALSKTSAVFHYPSSSWLLVPVYDGIRSCPSVSLWSQTTSICFIHHSHGMPPNRLLSYLD